MNKKTIVALACMALLTGLTSCDKGGSSTNNSGDRSTPTYVDQDPYVMSIEIISAPKKLVYFAGEFFEASGLRFNAVWNIDGEEELIEDMTASDCEYSPRGRALTVEDKKVVFNIGGYEFSFDITVNDAVNIEEKYGNAKKQYLQNGTGSMSFNDNVRGYYYEMENATSLSDNIRIADDIVASGGKYISYFNPNEEVMFSINSSVEVDTLMMLSGAMENRVEVMLTSAFEITYGTNLDDLSNKVETYYFSFTGTGQWNIFKEFNVGEIHLEEGINYIKIKSLRAINYDFMSLVNVYDESRDSGDIDDKEIDLEEKYGTPTKNQLLDGTNNMKFDDSVTGYYYEAEDADLSSGITLETGSMSGGQGIGRFRNGETMTFSIISDVETDALVILSLTRWNDGDLSMSDAFLGEYGTDLENLTKSINTFQEYNVGEVHLGQGVNYIKFTAYQAVNVDYMCLVNPLIS